MRLVRVQCRLLSFVLALCLSPSAFGQAINKTFQSAASSGNGAAMDVAGLSLVGVEIIGSSGADRVVNFEASQDGTNYVGLTCKNMASLAQASTATVSSTTAQLWTCPLGGMSKFRTRLSGGTTGTVTVTGTALSGVSFLPESTAGGGAGTPTSRTLLIPGPTISVAVTGGPQAL